MQVRDLQGLLGFMQYVNGQLSLELQVFRITGLAFT